MGGDMSPALQEIIEAWPDAALYPDLLAALDLGGSLTASVVSQGLLAGWAGGLTPRAAVVALVNKGEFRAAARALASLGDQKRLTGSEQGEAQTALTRAQRAAAAEGEARLVALRGRAEQVGLALEAPADWLPLPDRQADVDAAVSLFTGTVEAAEQLAAREIRADLAATGDAAHRAVAVEACLAGGAFRAARGLLAAVPPDHPHDHPHPAAVPRPPVWSWTAHPLEVTGWFRGTRPAPPDFLDRWRPVAADPQSAALLGALEPLASGRFDAEIVRAFAGALDGALGAPVADARAVEQRGAGFETRLYAAADPRFPFLAAGPDGVRLWLPSPAETDTTQNDSGPPRIGFRLTAPAGSQRGVVWFGASAVFRLLLEPRHRRSNFLRELGARVPLPNAMPAGSEGLPVWGAESAAWLFDILGVTLEGPSVIQELCFYAGDRPDLLLLLVREVLKVVKNRHTRVGREDVTAAWRSPAFREPALGHIRESLGGFPWRQAVLGAVLEAGQNPGTTIGPEDVLAFLAAVVTASGPLPEVGPALQHLVDRQLLQTLPGGRYLIPRTGLSYLLFDEIQDRETYVHSVLGYRS